MADAAELLADAIEGGLVLIVGDFDRWCHQLRHGGLGIAADGATRGGLLVLIVSSLVTGDTRIVEWRPRRYRILLSRSITVFQR